jgi:hypothetical protein
MGKREVVVVALDSFFRVWFCAGAVSADLSTDAIADNITGFIADHVY